MFDLIFITNMIKDMGEGVPIYVRDIVPAWSSIQKY